MFSPRGFPIVSLVELRGFGDGQCQYCSRYRVISVYRLLQINKSPHSTWSLCDLIFKFKVFNITQEYGINNCMYDLKKSNRLKVSGLLIY